MLVGLGRYGCVVLVNAIPPAVLKAVTSVFPGDIPWWRDGYAAIAEDGSTVYPSYIDSFITNQYAKGAYNGVATSSTFAGNLENFTRASTATYFDATGALRTAAVNEPRFTYDPATLQPLGLLAEEARTNYLRNNKLLGGDVGTNTLPTNVSFGTYTGFTVSGRFAGYGDIAGTTGAKYIDLKFTCAASGAVASLAFDTSTAIPALQNEVYAASCYVQLISGSYTNLTTEINVVSRNDSGGFIANESTSLFTATSTVSRAHSVGTLTAATTAYTAAGLVVRSTGAGDITLRIWLPQHEKVSGATQLPSSPILTDGSAVTRARDIIRTTSLEWFNQEGGTFILAFTPIFTSLPNNSYDSMLSINNGASSYIEVVKRDFTGGARLVVAGVGNTAETIAMNGMQLNKLSMSFTRDTSYSANSNGGVPLEINNTTDIPDITQLDVAIGRVYDTASMFIQTLIYYPKRLTTSEIQRLTSL